MHKLSKPLIGVALVVIMIIGASLVRSRPATEQVELIQLGAILPLTGPASELGQAHRESIEWVTEVLRTHGVFIEVVFEDSQTDPKKAVSAFNNLVETKGINIILTTLSSDTLAIKPLAEEKRVLLISDATHPKLLEDTQLILRHSFTVDRDADVIASHIKQQSFQHVGVLYQQDDVGKAYYKEFSRLAKEKGFSLISDQVDQREGDFRSALQKMIVKKPDAIVFVAIGPAAGRLVRQSHELGYDGVLYSWPGFIATPDAVTIAGESAKGMFYSTFPINEKFIRDFTARFGRQPSVIGSWKFTDIELLIHAIQQTHTFDTGVLAGFIKAMKEFQGTYESVEIDPDGSIIVPTHIEQWEK